MRIRVPLEAGAGAPWRCEEQRFSAVAAHPLLGQPLLALDQHEEVTCTRREQGQIRPSRRAAVTRAITGAAARVGGVKGGSPEYHEQPRAKAPPRPMHCAVPKAALAAHAGRPPPTKSITRYRCASSWKE